MFLWSSLRKDTLVSLYRVLPFGIPLGGTPVPF